MAFSVLSVTSVAKKAVRILFGLNRIADKIHANNFGTKLLPRRNEEHEERCKQYVFYLFFVLFVSSWLCPSSLL